MESREHDFSAVSEKVDKLLKDITELNQNGKDRRNREVQDKEKEIQILLRAPENKWLPPDKTIQELDKFVKQFVMDCEASTQIRADRYSPDIIRNASGGLALRGIFVSKDLQELSKERKTLLEVPENVTFVNSSKGPQDLTVNFDCLRQEQHFQQCVHRTGLNISGGTSGKRWGCTLDITAGYDSSQRSDKSSSSKKETTYASILKYSSVPMASCELNARDLRLSGPALDSLRELQNIVKYEHSDASKHRHCAEFLYSFGSHVNCSTIVFGGIFETKAETSSYRNDEKSNVFQLLSDVMHFTANVNLFGIINVDNAFSRTSSLITYINNYTQEQLKNTTVSIHKVGGPPTASDLIEWKKGLLSHPETWQVIDRGSLDELLPVWVVLLNHISDLEDCELLAQYLRRTWEKETQLFDQHSDKMIKSLREIEKKIVNVQMWNSLSEEDFLKNCEQYVSECQNFKVTLACSDLLWYEKFLCVSEVQRFIEKAAQCTEHCKNKLYLKITLSGLLEPPELIQTRRFPNIAQILCKLSDSAELVDPLNLTLESAMGSVKKMRTEFLKVSPEDTEAHRILCLKLHRIIDALQLNLKEKEKYADVLVLGVLNLVFNGPHGDLKISLTDKDLDSILSQMGKIENILETLKSFNDTQSQAFLIYEALKSFREAEWQEKDCTAGVKVLCEKLGKEISPKLKRVAFTDNDHVKSDLQNLEDQLMCLYKNEPLPSARKASEQKKEFEEFLTSLDQAVFTDAEHHSTTGNNDMAIQKLLQELEMNEYYPGKLKLRDVLDIGMDSVMDPTGTECNHVIWNFIRKVLMANSTARKAITPPEKNVDTGKDVRQTDESDLLDVDELFIEEEQCTDMSFHPLDITVATLLCSDQLLQQELMSKMAMCQFAVPLLIPLWDQNDQGKAVSLFLWALRSIVKKWTPQSLAASRGFIEDNVVATKMPMVSFVRLGDCKESKSKMLNEILSEGQLSFFVNQNMEHGDIKRRISDGVAEMCWYLPSGSDTLDSFSEAFAVVNLRGDALQNSTQICFLTEVSSAIFMFVDKIGEEEKEFITSHSSSLQRSKLFLVMNTSKKDETAKNLKSLIPLLQLKKDQCVQFGKSASDILRNLRERVSNVVKQSVTTKQKLFSLEEIADVARRQGISVDEDEENCKKGKEDAKEMIAMMKVGNVADFKRNNLHYQGDQWKMWSKIDKEQSRLKVRGAEPAAMYIDKLEGKKRKLREEQLGFKVSNFMMKFIKQIHSQDHAKMFFVQWLKLELDSRSRKDLKVLHSRYKQLCDSGESQGQELKNLDRMISESSLGLEHLLREMGQIYEATASNSTLQESSRYQQLPRYAAKLMLDGIPLELIDGDASNIPLQWVTNVFEEIENLIGKESRMFVVTVLGVQSTGKSTLLNTMFGLQFAVSSGRCTRGAFMQLLRVKDDIKQKLGCDFVMVIDTEGLKAPELAQLDDSYEHDNELATVVIGLSDLTLINMSMENSTEMRDTLQIVVHAFIRMREVGRRPNCQFVHQNAGDVSAHEKNIRDRRHFLDQLNEMTKAAARMEGREEHYSSFRDVMDYEPTKSNWYIGSLWHGNPPMAAVNTGYCKNVLDLKLCIFDRFEQRQNIWKPRTIHDFGKWMKNIWAAVKKENFIFSFKNSLVAEAYNELSLKYCDWEWELRRFIMTWTQQSENEIKNASETDLSIMLPELERDLNAKIKEKIEACIQKLEEYFNSGKDNVNLIERYKAEFQHSLQILGMELKNSSISKCSDTISRQKGLQKLNQVQRGYQQEIESQVNGLLLSCKKHKTVLCENELESEFENMWRQVTSKFPNSFSVRRNVASDMENAVWNTIPAHNHLVQENLNLIKEDHLDEFTVKTSHVDLRSYRKVIPEMIYQFKDMDLAEQIKQMFIYNSKKILNEKVKDNINYDQNYCQEMLRAIDELLKDHVDKSFKFNESFKVDFKLYFSGHAVKRFKEMQDKFYQENDPMEKLRQQKKRYLEIFKDTYCKRDQTHKKADMFCRDCLKPAIMHCIESKLGASLLEDLRSNRVSLALSTSKFFHVALLVHMMKVNDFTEYYRYINHYEDYATEWVKKRVLKHCAEQTNDGKTRIVGLAICILKQLSYTIKEAIKDVETCTDSDQMTDFMEAFVKKMDKELVIPTHKLDIITFQSHGNIKHFAEAILIGVHELEKAVEEEITKWDVEETVLNLSTKPTEKLVESLLNCKKQCPFCGVPCERAGKDHSEHFSEYHIPDGLCGYMQNISNKLSTEICTSSVSSGELFQNEDTDYKYVAYKNYKSVNDFYRSWEIQADSSYKASSYWKSVFYRFNNQFAHRYAAEPATIPEGWNISEEQVRKDLEEAYQVSLESVD